MGVALLGDVVAHTGRQQRPEHIREGEQQQTSTAKRINRPDGWPSEQKIDETESERGEEGFLFRGATLLEDGGRVESDDVDYTGLAPDNNAGIQDNLLPHIC